MRLPLASILIATLVVSSFAPSLGQSDDETLPSSGEERVRVRLVQVPIIARDRNGAAIDDLTADEMRVKVQGDPMRVAFLDPIAIDPSDDVLPETRLRVNAPGGADAGTAVDDSATSGPTRYFVLFIDMENDFRLGRPDALLQAIRFVEETRKPSDRFAVLSYDGTVRQESPFTNNLDVIRTGLETAFGRGTGRYVDLTRRMLDLIETMKLCQDDAASAYLAPYDERCLKDTIYAYADRVRPRAKSFVDALDSIITVMSGIEGRKTVLALSHGFAVDPYADVVGAARSVFGNDAEMTQWLMTMSMGEGARSELDRVIGRAVDAQVTLHFVDRNPVPNVDTSARVSAAFQPGGERPVAGAHAAAQADIEEVAANTGGVLVKTLDVYEGLSKAMALERGAYMLGYYIDRYVKPEKLRKANISAARRGVKIAHQRGTYSSRGSDTGASDVIGKIIVGEPSDLQEQEEIPEGGSFIPFHVMAEPTGIGYEVVGNQAESTFSVHVQLLMADGRPLRDSYHLINHAYPLSLWQSRQIGPVVFDGWVEVPPGEYVLRAVIRNANSKAEGTFEEAIRVPGA